VGLVGAGFMGQRHAQAYSAIDGVTLCGVYDANTDKAAELADLYKTQKFSNFDDMLRNGGGGLDAVDICLPTHLHKAYVEQALRAGCPVVCEKPMALSFEDADAMCRLSRELRVPLMIAHCLRFHAAYGALRQILRNETYGKLHTLCLYRHTPIPRWSEGQWLHNAEMSGGIAMDLHIHDIDFVLWLLGMPRWVMSKGDNTCIHTVYGFDGPTVSSEASWRTQDKFPFNAGYDANFERATLRYENGNGNENYTLYTDTQAEAFDPGSLIEPDLYADKDAYVNELAYFVKCVREGRIPDHSSPEESRDAVVLALAEKESKEQSKRIDIRRRTPCPSFCS